METTYLAGGCFWCIEEAFFEVEGIISTTSGYMGGASKNPTYEEVSKGNSGHREVVEVQFDPDKITYLQVLEIFWRHIDPFDEGGQFADRGEQYETAIFTTNGTQKTWAERSKKAVEELFGKNVATKILTATVFYEAEEGHQQYCTKNPIHFYGYQKHHEPYLAKLWAGKVIPLDPKDVLTPLQYKVTHREGTEPPFQNAYCDNHQEGIYVDRISGDALFASTDKFDSGTGWPSFVQPIDKTKVMEHQDFQLSYPRTEVRGAKSGAHLGHVFPDGPKPTGLRYCMNSASLRFIPKHKMAQEGYGHLLPLFDASGKPPPK